MPIDEKDIKWGRNFVCDLDYTFIGHDIPKGEEIVCDFSKSLFGLKERTNIFKGKIKGNDIITHNISVLRVPLSMPGTLYLTQRLQPAIDSFLGEPPTVTAEELVIPMELEAHSNNIIGCYVDERSGIIRCVEDRDTEEGKEKIMKALEPPP